MKNYLLSVLFLVFIIAFAPFLTLISLKTEPDRTDTLQADSLTDGAVRVLQVSSGHILESDLTEYLIGAVASEMPASYSEEALKAQAVASYTYLKWILLNSDNTENGLWDISDDSNTHQGFLSKEQMKEHWGEKHDTYYSKLKKVVEDVKKEYIAYEKEPILAVFHGISSGSTADSETVWGYSIPYLVSTDAPGDKLSPDLVSKNTFSYGELATLIKDLDGVSTEGISGKDLVKIVSSDENGYVKEVSVGNSTMSGAELKALLKLKSPNFIIKASENKIEFTVYGKGHGLGMSQYSADFMARQGYTYKEILGHFYPGTELLKD